MMPRSASCSAVLFDTKCSIVAVNHSSSSSENMVDILSGRSISWSRELGFPKALFHPAGEVLQNESLNLRSANSFSV